MTDNQDRIYLIKKIQIMFLKCLKNISKKYEKYK